MARIWRVLATGTAVTCGFFAIVAALVGFAFLVQAHPVAAWFLALTVAIVSCGSVLTKFGEKWPWA